MAIDQWPMAIDQWPNRQIVNLIALSRNVQLLTFMIA
jgi:hypothetical protein